MRVAHYGLLTLAVLLSAPVLAEQVRCESRDGRREECRIDGRNGVRLVDQLSSADCREGRTWGYSRNQVWVDEGCRAVFASTGSQGYRSGNARGDDRVRCESRDGRREECRIDGRNGVRLVEQLSDADCREGRNWGYSRDQVWVEDGCRAVFSASSASSSWQGSSGGDKVRCESRDGKREECRIDGRNGVRLSRQLSDKECREGRNWGYDNKRVWVDDGCRAEFVGSRQDKDNTRGRTEAPRHYDGPFHDRLPDAAALACMRFKTGAEEIIDVSGPNLSWYEVILRTREGRYRCAVTASGRVEKYELIGR